MNCLYLILLYFVSFFTRAETINEPRFWTGINHKSNVSKFSIWQDVQLRYDLHSGGMQQTLIRIGPLYNLGTSEVGLLGTYVQTGLIKEYRPTVHHSISSGNIDLRNRLELRKIEENPSTSMRLRLLLKFDSNKKAPSSLVIWDEPFINLTNEDWTGSRIFERNRFFIGYKFIITEIKYEIGYLNQFIPRSDVQTFEHITSVNIFY